MKITIMADSYPVVQYKTEGMAVQGLGLHLSDPQLHHEKKRNFGMTLRMDILYNHFGR